MTKITHVTFERIFPREVVEIPLADAFTFFEQNDYRFHPTHATVLRIEPLMSYDDKTELAPAGEIYKTFAKAWMVWDFAMLRYRMVRLGLGAYGDGGPENPELLDYRTKLSQHLTQGGWVAGINWENRADCYRVNEVA